MTVEVNFKIEVKTMWPNIVNFPNDLKPCPFCGGDAKIIYNRSLAERKKHGYLIMCNQCGGSHQGGARWIAKENWNRRPNE